MFTAKQARMLHKFLDPYIRIDENIRKMKEIYRAFKDAEDFEKNAHIDQLTKIRECMQENNNIRRELGEKVPSIEIEILQELNEEIQKRETKQHEVQN